MRTIMSYVPQRGDEAAYVGFALVKALIDALVTNSIITRDVAKGIANDAVTRIAHATPLVTQSEEGLYARAAEFIRHTMLGQK